MIMRLVFQVSILLYAETAKILVFNPRFGYSHTNFMGRMADELQLAGHDVTVLQTIIQPTSNDTGSKHAKVIVIPADKKTIEMGVSYRQPDFWDQMWMSATFSPFPILGPLALMKTLFAVGCENMLSQQDLLKQMRDEKFDLGITELFDFSGIPLFHEIGLKNIVGASSLVIMEGAASASGLPLFESYIPGSQSVLGDDRSFFNRALNYVFTFLSFKFQNDLSFEIQKIMTKRYPEAPPIWETVGNMSIMFTNSDPLLDFPKPTLHKIVDLGGIGLRPTKPVDKHFNKILNLRKKTVLVSFGSLAPSITMPSAMKQNIVKTFKKFPDATFIWKYEDPFDPIIDGAENIILTKWAPQNDLLADPRLSFFITHGGAGSTFEGAARGVPLALFPLFGDQMRNARMAERSGLGFVCYKSDLFDENKFEEIVRKGLYDENLNKTAKKVASLLKKRPFQPRELLLKYIDLALEIGSTSRLSPKGRNYSTIEHYNLDLLFVALISLFVVLLLLIAIIRSCMSCLHGNSSSKQKNH